MADDATTVDMKTVVNMASRYFSIVITSIVAFLLTPFLIRALGKSAYGLQSLSHQALEFVGIAASAIGIGYDRLAAAHFARGEYDRMNSTLSAGLVLSLIASVAVLIGATVLAHFAGALFDLPPDLLGSARWVLLILGAGTACHIINAVYRSPVFITQRLFLHSLGSTIAVLISAAIVVPLFIYRTPSIVAWVAVTVIARVGTAWFFIIPLGRRGLPQLKINAFRKGTRRELKGLMNFSALAFIGGLGSLLYYATDSIMIANLDGLGISQVTNYNVAQRWHPQIQMLAYAFVGVLAPVMTADSAVGNMVKLRQTVSRTIRHCFAVLAFPCLMLALNAEPFLRHWLKDDFAPESVPVMRLIMSGLLLSTVGIVGVETLYACRKIGRVVAATLVGGALNVVLSVSLVKFGGFGISGVAIGSVVSLFLLHVVCVPLFLCHETSLKYRSLIKALFRAVCGAIPLVACTLLLGHVWKTGSFAELLAQFAVCGAVYAPSVWFISMTDNDRRASAQVVTRCIAALRGMHGAESDGPSGGDAG